MTRRAKIFIPNEIYFITFTILGWKRIFTSDKRCEIVYKWLNYIRKNYVNKIHGYVIMPNHVHFLIRISIDSPRLSILIMNAKKFMAYQIVNELTEKREYELLAFFRRNARTKDKAKHRLFESRYDSLIIQSRKLFLQKLNYIHDNPCHPKWNLASQPEQYRHSSAAQYIGGKGFYEVDIIDF